MSINESIIKIGLALTIFAMGLLSVLAPYRLATGSEQSTTQWFSLGNMAASGILLSAGLVHQLADSAEQLNLDGGFPWAMFVAGLTFVGFTVLEETIHIMFSSMDGCGEEDQQDNGACSRQEHNHKHDHEQNHQQDHEHEHEHDHDHDHKSKDKGNDDVVSESQSLLDEMAIRHTCVSCRRSFDSNRSRLAISYSYTHQPVLLKKSSNDDRSYVCEQFSENSYKHEDHHHHDAHLDLHLHGSPLSSCILMLALSTHSILAGVSIGIESSPKAVASTAIAILAHKTFEGLALGSSFVTAQVKPKPFWILAVTFACATPFGILLGQYALSQLKTTKTGNDGDDDDNNDAMSNHVVAIVQAIVAGTFLYISIVEIGTKELLSCREQTHDSKRRKKLDGAKLLCFIVGFLAMSGLAVYV